MKKLLLTIPVLLIGILVAYHGLMFYDNRFPLGRMRETPAVRPHEKPIFIMDETTVPVSGGEMVYKTAAPASLTPPFDLNDTAVQEMGKTVYGTHCRMCHGARFDGNGTVGQSFAPLPRDLRSGDVQARKPGELFHEISYGIPGGRQPALATTIEKADRWRVVAYIKALGIRK